MNIEPLLSAFGAVNNNVSTNTQYWKLLDQL